jgi:hypothetical protein
MFRLSKLTLSIYAGAIAFGGWYFRDSPPMQRALNSLTQSIPAAASLMKEGKPTHKCLRDGVLIYTDGPCPLGTTEQQIENGTLSVIDGQRALVEAQKAAERSGGNNDVDEAMPELKEQRRKAQEAAERAQRMGKAVRP